MKTKPKFLVLGLILFVVGFSVSFGVSYLIKYGLRGCLSMNLHSENTFGEQNDNSITPPENDTVYLGFYNSYGVFLTNDGEKNLYDREGKVIGQNDYYGRFYPDSSTGCVYRDGFPIDFRSFVEEPKKLMTLEKSGKNTYSGIGRFVLVPSEGKAFLLTHYESSPDSDSFVLKNTLYIIDIESGQSNVLWSYEGYPGRYEGFNGFADIIGNEKTKYVIISIEPCSECSPGDDKKLVVAVNLETGKELALGEFSNPHAEFDLSANKVLITENGVPSDMRRDERLKYICYSADACCFQPTGEVRVFNLP